MSLPTTSAQPLRFVAPGSGSCAVWMSIAAEHSEERCAICSSEDRVAPEPIPDAEGLEVEDGLSLPLCGECAREQLKTMGKGWWLAIVAALIPCGLVLGLVSEVSLPLWAALGATALLLAAGFWSSTTVLGRLRREAIPILRVSADNVQVPALAGDAQQPGHLPRQVSTGFVLPAIFVALAAPFLWEASMPALILDNPRVESCDIDIDGTSEVLSGRLPPREGRRLHASKHTVVVRCGASAPTRHVVKGAFGQAVLITTDPNTCYTAQSETVSQVVGMQATTTTTWTTQGVVQYPIATPVSRVACGRPHLAPFGG